MPIAIGGIIVPDTKLAREIAELVRDTESPLLFSPFQPRLLLGRADRRAARRDISTAVAGSMVADLAGSMAADSTRDLGGSTTAGSTAANLEGSAAAYFFGLGYPYGYGWDYYPDYGYDYSQPYSSQTGYYCGSPGCKFYRDAPLLTRRTPHY
jgi:hypothetical protein